MLARFLILMNHSAILVLNNEIEIPMCSWQVSLVLLLCVFFTRNKLAVIQMVLWPRRPCGE